MAICLLVVGVWWAVVELNGQGSVSRPMPPGQRNLKLIGLALHHYDSDFGCLPPAGDVAAEPASQHSWRVLIVPYLIELWDREGEWLKEHRPEFRSADHGDFVRREKAARERAQQLREFRSTYDLRVPWN